MRSRGLALLLVAASAIAAAPARAWTVSDRVDMAGTGFLADDELVPPLVERWSFPAEARTVLIGDGRVYVTDGAGAVAFDLQTGGRLWATGFEMPLGTAYHDGVLYVRTAAGLAALDGATGAFRWERPVPREFHYGSPVAVGDTVYVDADERVIAMRASDGAEVWRAKVMSGTGGLSTDGDRIFAAGPCGATIALSATTGSELWRHEVGCSGGGSDRVAVFGGRLYHSSEELPRGSQQRLPNPVLDAGGGEVVGRFDGRLLPVFVDGLAVTQARDDALHAVDAATGDVRWRNPGSFVRSPIAVGHDVYAVRDNRLTAFSSEDGRVVWQEPLPFHAGSDDRKRPSAAAPGVLVTSYGGRLVAWESFFKPPPHAVALGAGETDVTAGAEVSLTGVLGRDLRGDGVMVRIDGAEWRGRFERFADVRAARDGGFTTSAIVYRNSRFRVAAPGAGSDAVSVYASPRVVVGVPRRGSAGVGVRAPRTRLAGRTLVLYRDPPGDRPLRRLAAGRLRSTGPGRTRTRVALRNRRGEIVFCIRGQLKLGLGRPTPLTRRCGARRIRS